MSTPSKSTLVRLARKYNIRQIARQRGVHPTIVHSWYKYSFIRMPKFAGSKLTSHDKDLIQALLNDGMPLQQIADKFDVSYSTIRRMK